MNKVLIADAGSTKTHWLDAHTGQSYFTPGINPVHIDDEALRNQLQSARNSLPHDTYTHIAWYGAGCGSEIQCQRMAQALQQVFGSQVQVKVGSDLLCAAKATAGNDRAIVCILGTGSNSGLYDGQQIVDNIPPLGYILGDEGSGAAIGKRLVNAVLKRELSPETTQLLTQQGNIVKDHVQEQVYRQPNPNRYLATFARLAAEHIDNPEVTALVAEEIDLFLQRNVLRYDDAHSLPIHFVGGAAMIFKHILTNRLLHYRLSPGIIEHTPLNIPGDPMRFL